MTDKKREGWWDENKIKNLMDELNKISKRIEEEQNRAMTPSPIVFYQGSDVRLTQESLDKLRKVGTWYVMNPEEFMRIYKEQYNGENQNEETIIKGISESENHF